MGTPAYMAPEQVEGREPGSRRGPVFAWAWCCTKWRSGRLPFPGASLGQMLSSGSNLEYPRRRGSVPECRPAWMALVAALLEKDPARRPQSASEVARDLSAIADAWPPRPLDPDGVLSTPSPLVAICLLALAAWLYLRSKVPDSQSPIPNNPAAYTQLTSFTDSAVPPGSFP